jgi:hypothetical protein
VEFETIRGYEGYERGWGGGVGRGRKVICGGSIFCGAADCHVDKSRIGARKRREHVVDLSFRMDTKEAVVVGESFVQSSVLREGHGPLSVLGNHHSRKLNFKIHPRLIF